MNDKTADDALKEILEGLDASEQELYPNDDENANFIGDSDLSGFTDFQEDQPGTATNAADIKEIGFNWGALFWLFVLLGSVAALIYTEFEKTLLSQNQSRLSTIASELNAQTNEIRYQALRVSGGDQDAFDVIENLRAGISENLTLLQSGEPATGLKPVPSSSLQEVRALDRVWKEVLPELDVLLSNRSAIEMTVSEVAMVNEITPKLLDKTEEVVTQLIRQQAEINLINVAARQRFLSQRIKADMNEFAAGAPGWESAATQFSQDVELFGQTNAMISRQGGEAVSDAVNEVETLYGELVSSSDGVINHVDEYFSMRNSADRVTEISDVLDQLSGNLRKSLGTPGEAVERQSLWILEAVALLSLLPLLWSVIRHQQKKSRASSLKAQASEDAVIRLLDEMGDLAQGDLTVEAEVTDEVTGAIADSVNFAVSEMRVLVEGMKTASFEVNNATDSTESLIARLLVSSDSQSEQITSAAKEVSEMTEAIARMSKTASQSSEQARISAEVAQKGAGAVRKTVQGMNITRNQIQDTAKRLKRLGESSQQINEIVNLIQDVTEQTNVLSLNASIQAAMAGEAGKGFAVVAEEVQRLAERSARASNDITALVQNIQQDVNNAIISMESTTEEVVSGAKMADEAGQALNEIESMSERLLETIEEVAEDAQKESTVAQTVASRMETLNSATKESDKSVSQVAISLEQMRSVAERLTQSVLGFKLPQ